MRRPYEEGAAGTPAAPAVEELAQARDIFAHALGAGDALGVSAAYAEDAKLLAPSTDLVTGREEIEAFWQAGIEAGIADLTLEPRLVEQRNAIAFETGIYTLRVGTGDEGIVDRGTYTLVHERQRDGRWLRAVELLNPDAKGG
jgi:uncharacterized protein (TIGR02246 family)